MTNDRRTGAERDRDALIELGRIAREIASLCERARVLLRVDCDDGRLLQLFADINENAASSPA